ncbi:hypothetical protein [Brevibacillus sp. MS2.2]
MMPAAFRELQEWEARNFTRYAALPLHMLQSYEFKLPEIVEVLSEKFNVSSDLCNERIEKIRNKLYTKIPMQLIFTRKSFLFLAFHLY